MSSKSNVLLMAQIEKPNHYSYLKEFRVKQCPQFLQGNCSYHRPFTCFNWHFMNQRRRRPVKNRDGTFNYSADNYCKTYDGKTGICPDGDLCPYLHGTAGDTERRYHLKNYKTIACWYDTDFKGYCAEAGKHCAFAHGSDDQRPPVIEKKKSETTEAAEAGLSSWPNGLDTLDDKQTKLKNLDLKLQGGSTSVKIPWLEGRELGWFNPAKCNMFQPFPRDF